MKTIIEKFHIIGIAVRTQNIPGKAEADIPQLWTEFMEKNILEQIPNRFDNNIYCIYTDYEGDYTQPYTTVLGCKVNNLDKIPDGLKGYTFETNQYEKFVAKGKMIDGFVYNEWLKIWASDLNRNYKADFEIYDEKARDKESAEVSIFVGIEKE